MASRLELEGMVHRLRAEAGGHRSFFTDHGMDEGVERLAEDPERRLRQTETIPDIWKSAPLYNYERAILRDVVNGAILVRKGDEREALTGMLQRLDYL